MASFVKKSLLESWSRSSFRNRLISTHLANAHKTENYNSELILFCRRHVKSTLASASNVAEGSGNMIAPVSMQAAMNFSRAQ